MNETILLIDRVVREKGTFERKKRWILCQSVDVCIVDNKTRLQLI